MGSWYTMVSQRAISSVCKPILAAACAAAARRAGPGLGQDVHVVSKRGSPVSMDVLGKPMTLCSEQTFAV
jgi:hypothetical protein